MRLESTPTSPVLRLVALVLGLLVAGPLPAQEEPPEEPALPGTLVPAESVTLALWPREAQGEFLFLEVLPHGSHVLEGQVVARLDPRALDRQIHQVELELQQAHLDLEEAHVRAALAEEAAGLAREKAQAALERARRALQGWHEHELPLWERGARLAETRAKAHEEDQEAELTQLEAMYREDELVDATEEIVLQRSRRNLALTREGNRIAADRRAYESDFQLRTQSELKQEAVRDREAELQRLLRTHEIERRQREGRLARREDALQRLQERLERLQQDREDLELRAPVAGLLLHGAPDDYRPGRTPPRHRRGGRAPLRQDIFTIVARPDRLAVAVDVPESRLPTLRSGAGARIVPVAAPGRVLVGRLRLERFPDPASAGRPENAYRGTLELPDPAPGLVPGMRVTVRFGHQDAEPAGEEGPILR